MLFLSRRLQVLAAVVLVLAAARVVEAAAEPSAPAETAVRGALR